MASAKQVGLCTKISQFVQSVADHGVDGRRHIEVVNWPETCRYMKFRSNEHGNDMSTTPQAPRLSAASAKPISLVSPSLRERVREATRQIESEIILETLEQNRWNRRRAAKALGISYRLLMYKMKSGNLREENVSARAAAR